MTLARRTVTSAAAPPVSPARDAETASPALAGLISAKRLIRAAVHVACWVPFLTCVADSWRGPWRAVGDGARIALESWNTLGTRIPLLGQSNELPHTPRDLGPMQFWLLAIPVHADADRGVLWGAALLAMLAVSLTVEAAYRVLGETGGVLAGAVVIATVAWFPSFAVFPYDNPNFAMMFFLAALSACLAVLSGHRNWWPVLVVTASISAQAYLTFAAASVGLVLVAVVTGLVDRFRAKGGYSWLIAGLVVGIACWMAPLEQQFTSRAGKGNMSLLLHANPGQRMGVAVAMKAMAWLGAPSPLWWGQNIGGPDFFQPLAAKPAAFGLVILAVMASSLVIAVWWFRSRELAGLAAIGLLVSVTAAATFALVPVRAITVGNDVPLIFVMFAAVLLAWLTVICVIVLAAGKLISDRRRRAGAAGGRAPGGQQRAPQDMIPLPVRWAAALLVITVLLGAVRQVADYPGPGPSSLRVSAVLAMIERSLPRQRVITVGVFASHHADRYTVSIGLDWALTADGYHFDTTRSRRNRTIWQIAVVIRGGKMTVRIKQKTCRPVADTQAMRTRLCAPGA